MQLPFYKYHGAGNDFVLLNGLSTPIPSLPKAVVATLCARHTGIGADGLLVLQPPRGVDTAFELVYYNADGGLSTLCGNGSRCAVALAHLVGVFGRAGSFAAADGPHRAELLTPGNPATVALEMIPPTTPEKVEEGHFLDTGSPHVVVHVNGLADYPVHAEGLAIRNQNRHTPEGTNVNFVEKRNDTTLAIRTYERGVEGETLACGTGVTAAAWVQAELDGRTGSWAYSVQAQGGTLEVRFEGGRLWLIGPAAFVYQGVVEIPSG